MTWNKITIIDSSFSEQNINANRIYHDYIADKYEHDPRVRMGIMHPNCGRRLEWLKERYNIQKGSSVVLNLGCGTGNLMKKSEEVFGFTVGMDISLNMLQQAKRYTNRLIQGDALRIPLKSESVNLVFCIALLHHIYNLEGFFRYVYRILKSGGIFYSDYDPNRRFFETITKVPFFSFFLSIYKKTSDKFIFTKKDKKTWKAVHDMAEYHEEFQQGLEAAEVASIAREIGFSQVKCICHSDSPDLDYPRKGRLAHNTLNLLLSPFSKDYNGRTKIFSVIAIK